MVAYERRDCFMSAAAAVGCGGRVNWPGRGNVNIRGRGDLRRDGMGIKFA